MNTIGMVVVVGVMLLVGLGVANLLGKDGSAQTKAQSWAAIIAAIVVGFLVFYALDHMGLFS